MIYFDFWDMDPKRLTTGSSTATLAKSSPFYIHAPGYSKSDIDAELVDGNILIVYGKTNEYGGLQFKKSVYLDKDVDHKTISLTVKDGMISVEYKLLKEEPKKVTIK